MATRDDIQRCISRWAQRLWLDHWHIEVEWDTPADEGAHAEVLPNQYRRHARLYLERGWTEWSDDDRDRTIVHELLHLSHRDVDHVVEAQLDGLLHRDVYDLIQSSYRAAMERFIDDTARILVESHGTA